MKARSAFHKALELTMNHPAGRCTLQPSKVNSVTVGLTVIIFILTLFQLTSKVRAIEPQTAEICSQWGLKEAGTGPILLLIHGFGAHKETWDEVMSQLKSDYHVIAIDLPGHGASAKPDVDYNAEFFTSEVEKLCDTLGLKELIMAGNSLGGGIAAALAIRRPDLVRTLVLVDSLIYNPGKLSFLQNWLLPLLTPFKNHPYPRFLVKLILKQVYCDDGKVTSAKIDEYAGFYTTRESRRAAFSTMKHLDFRYLVDDLDSIKQPTLIVWGAEDAWLPVHNAHELQKQILNSKLAILNGCGHVPMEECPDAFTTAFREFAQSLPSDSSVDPNGPSALTKDREF